MPIYVKFQGFAQDGGKTVLTSGLVSTTQIQQSYPLTTITVFDNGTTNLSTIYSDANGTPLSNPFTATSDGQWGFYGILGNHYDVQFSGGGIGTPFKLTDFATFISPPPITSFSDSLAVAPPSARNPISPPSDNWVLVPLGGDSPYTNPLSFPNFNFAQTLSSSGGFGLGITQVQFGANPPYSFAAGIIPVVAYVGSPIYLATQKFVQITYNNITANLMQTVLGVVNFVDASGTGVAGNGAICHDAYALLDQNGNAGTGMPGVYRFNSGATLANIFAATGNLAQGDVVRLSFDFTNSAQVTIVAKRNGSTVFTGTDTAASRLTGPCSPFIGCTVMANGGSAGYKNFSCGIGL